jgi:ATP-dependent RNA helicase SUPV3L1/SUV3
MTVSFRPPPGRLPAEARAVETPQRGRGVTAVLGPTNTGKTHLAIERMLGHDSGMIGLPLRLLAREVYGRIVARVGAEAVALVTGEEKIKPRNPRYWVSTVEAMPRDIPASFVAIDEVQMIADFDRGHVFTDALLHRRGRSETLLLGAATARPIIENLLPGVTIQTRPRLSHLAFAGARKITRLPPRSAIIAFSAEEVYAIAELVRRQRGGAAVVMGSLSPRTRNAQVELFQAGEVNHIVATDAIGMGLNLEIEHVAFAADRKFDGRRHRRLFPAEIAQIAGRAGRATQDGTFGTTGRCPDFDEDLVEALEEHRFDPLVLAQWRHSALDFTSIDRLEQTLARNPADPNLIRARKAEDEVTLELATVRPLIRDIAKGEAAVRRLWDLCQLPDYRKVSPASHADLVVTLYEAIMRKGAIDHDWYAREIKACDRIEGDIDALSWRLAQIRTWSYCANRPDWLRDATHWQNVTRRLEDKVSDALHERLIQRFIDRRTSVLMRRLKENVMLETEVKPTGDVLVEGQHIGRLEGFRFTPDANAEGNEAKTLRAAAAKALTSEIETRATRLSTANDDQLQLSLDGVIRYIGEPIATLTAGAKTLEPRVLVLADETLVGLHREMVETRLEAWVKAHVAKLLGPLLALEAPESLTGIARGIAFRIAENLGVLDRASVSADVRGLDQNARAELRKLGIRFGAHHLFVPALMKPGPRSLAAQLYALQKGGDPAGLRDVSHLAFSGRTSIPVDPAIDKELYRVAGFRVAGPRAVRVDILERLADLIRPAIAYRPGQTEGEPPPGTADGDGFVVTGAMTSLVGCAGAEFGETLRSLGYRSETRPGPAITVELKRAAPIAATAPVVVTPAGAEQVTDEAAPSPEPELMDNAAAPVAPEAAPADAGQIEVGESAPAAEAAASATLDAMAPAEVLAETPKTPDLAESATEGLVADAPAEVAETPVTIDVPGETAAETPAATSAEVSVETLPADGLDAPAAPVETEIWRVARAERPRGDHGRPRHGRRGEGGGQRHGEARAADGRPPQEGRPPRPEGENRQPHGDRNRKFEKFGRPQGGPSSGDRPPGGQPTGDRPQGDRPQQGRPHGDRNQGDRGGRSGGKPFQKPFRDDRNQQRPPVERKPAPEKVADPDSPFAKLAALKAQLEGKS